MLTYRRIKEKETVKEIRKFGKVMGMNLGTMVVLAILVCVVALVLNKMYKDKKAGKTCSSCGGGCSCGCEGCHTEE